MDWRPRWWRSVISSSLRENGRAKGGRSAAARPRTLFRRFCAARDAVATLNPPLLAGQVHGGTVQGIGQALLERAVYDSDSGQLVTASLMDYAVPRDRRSAAPLSSRRATFVAGIPLGVKGAGEGGAIGSYPAVMSATSCLPYPPPRHAGNAGARLEGDRRSPPGAGSVTSRLSARRPLVGCD